MINFWKYETYHRLRRLLGKRRLTAVVLRNFVTWYYRNATEQQLGDLYEHGYHTNYGGDDAKEDQIKHYQALAVSRALPDAQKILIAGCANGRLVQMFRALCLDAWGFDISSQAIGLAKDDLKPYLKVGNFRAMPYDRANAFQALVSVDVFEHIPANQVPLVAKSIADLGIDHLALVINHVDLRCVGHVTIKPLHWWRKAMADSYRLDSAISFDKSDIPPVYSLDDDPDSQFTFWRRCGV